MIVVEADHPSLAMRPAAELVLRVGSALVLAPLAIGAVASASLQELENAVRIHLAL